MTSLKINNITTIRERIKQGESVSSIIEEVYEAVKNEKTNSFLEFFESAHEDAKKLDENKDARLPPLFGIPIAVKDNIAVKGEYTTSSSKMLETHRSPYDATVIRRLKKAGAVIVGRVNQDEFAMGSTTETSSYGETKNPHDLKRIPGGSSGGSAACVASGIVPVALGSDTGGSIRQPAALCGVVGLKPTYGSVSRYGLHAFASSLDCIGPLTQTVEDAKLIFELLAGKDENDHTTIQKKDTSPFRKKIGVLSTVQNATQEVQDVFNECLNALKKDDYEVLYFNDDVFSYAPAAYYIIQPAEASSNLARYDGIRFGLKGEEEEGYVVKRRTEGFGLEVKRRIGIGTFVLSSGYNDRYYKNALSVKHHIREVMNKLFFQVDVLMTPTFPTTAHRIGEIEDPLVLYGSDLFTIPANLAGTPAVSIPIQKKGTLPVGIHVTASHGREDVLFEIGTTIEKLYARG